jgi:hypothetical protein
VTGSHRSCIAPGTVCMPSLGAWAIMGFKSPIVRYRIDFAASSVSTSGRWASALLSAATTLADVSLATPACGLSCRAILYERSKRGVLYNLHSSVANARYTSAQNAAFETLARNAE